MAKIFSPDELKAKLGAFPRVSLGEFPTPLDTWDGLRARWDRPGAVYAKREDLSGFAFGGNKVRQIEFLLGDALDKQCDCCVHGAAVQSNYCRVLAAACNKVGLDCHLVLSNAYHQSQDQGNFLLHRINGAHIEITDRPLGDAQERRKKEVCAELKSRGRRPYLITYPHSEILGTLSYLEAALEIYGQCRSLASMPDVLVCAAVGSTQSGILLGFRLLGWDAKVVGFSPVRGEFDVMGTLKGAMDKVSGMIGVENPVRDEEIINVDDYVGEGYGVMTDAGFEAIRSTARCEGVYLDPVYTGKAMAGLADYLAKGLIDRQDDVIFLHSGGTPALFGYGPELMKRMEGDPGQDPRHPGERSAAG